jgi:type II secretory pathway pseudopilin PulG
MEGGGEKAMDIAKRHADHSARSRGSSLIEVLVTMALVFFLIAGATELMIGALRAKRRADVTAALTHAITDRLASLRSLRFDDPALAAGGHAATERFEPGGCLVSETWEVADDGDGLKRIRLRVRQEGRPVTETSAVLFVSRDLGFEP